MKKLVVLLALVIQGLFTLNATVISARISAIQPVHDKPIIGGALIPLLNVDVKGTDRKFIPSVSFIVRTTGVSPWDPQVFSEVFIGNSEKMVSSSAPIGNNEHAILGPVHLQSNVWRTVTISARVNNDLSELSRQSAGLAIDSMTVNSYFVEFDDKVTYDGTFPIRGDFHSIDPITKAESLSIQYQLDGRVIEPSDDSVIATFDVVAEGGDVKISHLPIDLDFSDPSIDADIVLSNIRIENGEGAVLAEKGKVFLFEKKNGYAVYFYDLNLVVPQGTNKWVVKGSFVTNGLPEMFTVKVGVEYFGEAYGITTENWFIPTIENEGNVTTVMNPGLFEGTFQRHLSLGSVGVDVTALQAYLESNGFAVVNTGYFGETTKTAVEKFQTAHGIPATGFVGPITLALLNSKNGIVAVASVAKIHHVTLLDREDGRKDIFIQGTVKPNIGYTVEVTEDLKVWRVVGKTTPESNGMLKEHVGAAELGAIAFFRLVEKP